MSKILVTDGWTRKALSAVRSLGETGHTVHVMSHTWIAPALYSRHTQKRLRVPQARHRDAFLNRFLQIIRNEKYDCVLPMEDATIQALYFERDEIEKYTALPLPSEDDYRSANDKWSVMELAQMLQIPAPRSFLPSTLAEAHEAVRELGFPLVIKPRSSSGSRGLHIVENNDAFVHLWRESVAEFGVPVLQEYVPREGQGLGVGILCEHGEPRITFSYKRLREFPLSGGPSTLRESTDDPSIKTPAERLLRALKWHGVAMVEFKMDPRDNTPKLMEINPRFWGSLDLARAAGINFPDALVRLARGEEITSPQYRIGARARWLLGDAAHFLFSPKRFSLTPSFFDFNHAQIDEFDRADVQGSVAAFFAALASFFDVRVWKIGIFRSRLIHSLSTLFGIGYLPFSALIGSVLALGTYLLFLLHGTSSRLQIIFLLVLLVVAIIDLYRHRAFARSDPGEIIIDEYLGMLVALIFSHAGLVLAIVLLPAFRVLDVVKPPPFRWLNNHFRSWWGPLIDDLAIGACLAIVVVLFNVR